MAESSPGAARSEWGEYKGKKRLPCPENPLDLAGQPIGQYHCPYCGMMAVAGFPHLSPSPPAEQDPRYPLDHYEDEYGGPWPPGYAGDEMSTTRDEALAVVRLSFREQEAAPLEAVEAYVADALREAGFVVKRVNIEWLEEPTS